LKEISEKSVGATMLRKVREWLPVGEDSNMLSITRNSLAEGTIF